MRVGKSHPLLGWLRLDGATYSRTLDHSLRERDWALEINPNHSGHADGFIDWVWTVQLPELCRNSNCERRPPDPLGRSGSYVESALSAASNDQLMKQKALSPVYNQRHQFVSQLI